MGKFFEVINRVLIANEGWKVILSGLGKTVESPFLPLSSERFWGVCSR